MKNTTLALTACVVSAFGLALIFGAQAGTTTPPPTRTPTTAAPSAPKAPVAPEAPTAPGADTRVVIRPDPAAGAIVIPDDPDQRKNEANFRAAVENCNALVSPDSKKQCMAEAEANFAEGQP